jgi:hypothetical protein
MADYTIWRDTLGQTGVALRADADENGVVDAGDYAIWRAHFGDAASAGTTTGDQLEAANVPEPGAYRLLGSLVLSLTSRRRRQSLIQQQKYAGGDGEDR